MSYSVDSLCVGSRELVIFDGNVNEIQLLIDGIKPGIDWEVLNPDQDGIKQITDILANRSPVETLHIVSHGAPGCLFLGNTQLSLDTLGKYTTQLQNWFVPFAGEVWGEQISRSRISRSSPSIKALISQSAPPPLPPKLGGNEQMLRFFLMGFGDRDLGAENLGSGKPSILLYGCNVAAGDAGEEFIHKLHQITQASVAASQTPTGNPQLGGNWNLEAILGNIQQGLAFTPQTQTNYPGILANGEISITGDIQEDSELTAVVTDPDGTSTATITYQWQSSEDGNTWTDITDATNNTFTPGDDEVDKFLRVNASYTDDGGTAETVSASTNAIFSDPTVASTVNTTGPARDVSVLGDVAYVADNNGLQIIDISDPENASVVNTVNTAGNARGISVLGDFAYIADDAAGLQIIDISDPQTASVVNTVDTPGEAIDVSVVGDFAYVADDAEGLQIIDISVPGTASVVGTFDTSGPARGVSVVGQYAYVADNNGLQIIDISDPANTSLVGNVDTPGLARDVSVVGNFAYIADFAEGLQIIDISDPQSPSIVGSVDTPGEASDVSVVGDFAYVADDAEGLQIIDISDPQTASIVGTFNTPDEARGVSVLGDFAYVADYESDLQIINIDIRDSVRVANINDDPTAVTLDSTEVDENQDVGTVVGTFSSTDADTADSHTYTLVDGEGATDNGSFEIVDGKLQTKAVFDHETQANYNIRVETDDGNGGTFQQELTVTVGDVNEAGEISITGDIQEDSELTAVVTDPDGTSGDITYQWQSSEDGNTWTDITGATNDSFTPGDDEVGKFLRVNASYTDDGNTAETVTAVASTDQGPVPVANVNDDPTAITLDSSEIEENLDAGTVVGTLSSTDADTADSHTYTLVAGEGDTDNGSFEIVDGKLQTKAVFDHETQANYNIRVETDDGNGGTFQQELTISVNDVEEPVDEEPVDEEPVDEEPVDEEPVDEEPVDEEPVDEEPVDEEPVDEEPVDEEPVDEEPVDEEPVDEEPVDEEPVDEEPVDEEPVDEEPVVEPIPGLIFNPPPNPQPSPRPVDEEPVDEEPVDEEPVDEEPVDEEPVDEEPNPQPSPTSNPFDPSTLVPEIVSPVPPAIETATIDPVQEATPEADFLNGSASNDEIFALAGNDTVNAGTGSDWVNGNEGDDLIDAGAGDDTVYGGKQNDAIFGSAGNDWMNGNLSNDFLDGGDGMDTLYGGKESDTLQGGADNDWMNGNLDNDFLDGGDGMDTLYGDEESDTLQGGADNDELFGNSGADLMEGNEGNDILYGGQDNDTISGNNGNDTMYGDRGNDLLDGNAGNDIINGGQGNDTLNGGQGNDELMGDGGDDLLFGAGGADTLTGGAGQDQFVLTATSGSNIITDFTDGQDIIVLEDGLTFNQLSIEASQNATIIKFNDNILATLNGVESSLIAADDFTVM